MRPTLLCFLPASLPLAASAQLPIDALHGDFEPSCPDTARVKKFAYDIWGDTVNIASRMESSSEVGQVNISEATYALVKDAIIDEDGVASTHRVDQNRIGTATVPSQRPAFIFTPRGKVQAKGKGEMEMYFAHHPPALSQ